MNHVLLYQYDKPSKPAFHRSYTIDHTAYKLVRSKDWYNRQTEIACLVLPIIIVT